MADAVGNKPRVGTRGGEEAYGGGGEEGFEVHSVGGFCGGVVVWGQELVEGRRGDARYIYGR